MGIPINVSEICKYISIGPLNSGTELNKQFNYTETGTAVGM